MTEHYYCIRHNLNIKVVTQFSDSKLCNNERNSKYVTQQIILHPAYQVLGWVSERFHRGSRCHASLQESILPLLPSRTQLKLVPTAGAGQEGTALRTEEVSDNLRGERDVVAVL